MSKRERFFYKFYFLNPSKNKDGTLNWNEPTIIDTFDKWDIVCKSFPYDIMGDAKAIPSIDWVDYDGLEIYLPKDGVIPLKSQSVEVEFVCCSNDARAKVVSFLKYITGRDGSGVRLGVYDTYTGLAGTDIIYLSHKSDILHRRDKEKEIVSFKVELLFTKPMVMDMVIHPNNGDFNDDFNDDFLKEYIY